MRPFALATIASVLALTSAAEAAPALRTLSWPGKPETKAPAEQSQAPQLRPRLGVRPAAGGGQPGVRPLPKIEVQPAVFTPPPGVPAPSAALPAPAPYTAMAPIAQPVIAAAPLPPATAQATLAPQAPVAAAPVPAAPRLAPPAPAAPVAGAPQVRRYSLHREYGEQPDHLPPPTPVFLDNLPVSEDLAAPPPPPVRDKDERRAKADAFDPDASPVGEN